MNLKKIFVNRIFLNAIVWFVIFVLGIKGSQRVGLGGIYYKWFIACAAVALCIHAYKAYKDPHHLKKCFDLKIPGERKKIAQYDYLRVLAASFVILTHEIQMNISNGNALAGDAKLFVLNVIAALTLTCNLIYIMLSGALLLQWKEESLFDFYFRRGSKVFIPMAVYYFWYMWQTGLIQTNGIRGSIKDLFTASTPASPHYWLMYTILGLYVAYPFMRYMLKAMSYKMLTSLVVVCLIFMGITTFLPWSFGVQTFFANWIGIAIMGYWVVRPESEKYYNVLLIVACICVVISCILIWRVENHIRYISNCSPIVAFETMGMFALVFKAKRIFSKDFYPIRLLSKYSFPIILIHWWVLSRLSFGMWGLNVGSAKGLGVVIVYFVTLFWCLLTGIFIDNMFSIIFTSAADGAAGLIKKICCRK